jgi:hypothetical protein
MIPEIDTKKYFIVIKSFIDTKYTSDEVSTLLVRKRTIERNNEKALKTLDDAKKEC